MAGDEHHIFAERPEALGDAVNQILMIALGEIGPPDRALEQHIADNRKAAWFVEEHHVAGRVTGAMDHIERQFAHGHGVAMLEPAGRLEGLGLHAPAGAVIVKLRDPEAVILMRAFDRKSQLVGQHARLTAVIQMAMRYEDFFQRDACLLDTRLELVQITARIDQRALHRFSAPDQRAVLLQWRNGQDGCAHWWTLGRRGLGCVVHSLDVAANAC